MKYAYNECSSCEGPPTQLTFDIISEVVVEKRKDPRTNIPHFLIKTEK